MNAIEFIREAKRAEPSADKAALQQRYVAAFGSSRVGKIFVGDGYSLYFSWVGRKQFSGTVVGLSSLRKHDEAPFVVVVVRPDRVEFLISNTTFLTKIGHSSARNLRVDNIVGNFNGTDILKNYKGIPNDPTHFPELFADHESISWDENLKRLVKATSEITPRKQPFAPTAVQRELLLMAPERARLALATPGFTALEVEFQQRAIERHDDILAAARLDNGKLRGERIERLLVDGPGSHGLGDFEAVVDGFHLKVDIKTTLLHLHSSPKAYNVDKALEFMSRPNTVFAFLFVGIDRARENVSLRLLPVLETSLVDATSVVPHHAARDSRGGTLLSGNFHRAAADSYVPVVDVEKARQFIERLLAL